MRRPGLLLGALVGLSFVGTAAGGVGATTPPPPPVAPTSVPADPALIPGATTTVPAVAPPVGETTTTVPAVAPPVGETTTTVADAVPAPAPTIPRAGSAIGDLDKRQPATWTPRRTAVAVAIGVAALALLGHLYGRVRSLGPRRVTTSTAVVRRN